VAAVPDRHERCGHQGTSGEAALEAVAEAACAEEESDAAGKRGGGRLQCRMPLSLAPIGEDSEIHQGKLNSGI